MIEIAFEASNGKRFNIKIDNKKIVGIIKGKQLPYMPSDLKTVAKEIMASRNEIPISLFQVFKLTKEELAEFENAKDDNELKEIVLKDAKNKGCKLIDMKIE